MMTKLPKDIKLTKHAQQRLLERKDPNNNYNTKNLMRSTCKWYNRNDLIPNSALYLHSLYVCRKSNQMGYITDGNIEIVYNKHTGAAITVLEVKEKFLPITQYIKPKHLEQIEFKKEQKRMKKLEESEVKICPDCGKEVIELTSQNICVRCRTRKANAKHRNKKYIPYINLTEREKEEIDLRQIATSNSAKQKKAKNAELSSTVRDTKSFLESISTNTSNYYEIKAAQKPIELSKNTNDDENKEPQFNFINMLLNDSIFKAEYNDDKIEDVKKILNILIDENLKNIFEFMVNIKDKNIIFNLKELIAKIEKKLQYNWESSGFSVKDDMEFKNFLMKRRIMNDMIVFWKNFYDGLNIRDTSGTDTSLKKYQITTESTSAILNLKKPFTRVFYATSKEDAYEQFLKLLAMQKLIENRDKTIITELN